MVPVPLTDNPNSIIKTLRALISAVRAVFCTILACSSLISTIYPHHEFNLSTTDDIAMLRNECVHYHSLADLDFLGDIEA